MRSVAAILLCLGCISCATPFDANSLGINQLQFVGSHNSYKQAMSPDNFAALRKVNPEAALTLEYSHPPLTRQLELGLRKLELDVFVDGSGFAVGHVQQIDMNSHCAMLSQCLTQVRQWSEQHPSHVPIWISFNAKDQAIEGLPTPAPFDAGALARLDQVVVNLLGDKLITPADVVGGRKNKMKETHAGLRWPTLAQARGKFLMILDEGGAKRELYYHRWQSRPLFTNAPRDHAAAAVMIINDPIASADEIRQLVADGYLVRTRADADTREARSGDVSRRGAAFASGAQAISTDYYETGNPFGTQYVVDPVIRCNPVNVPSHVEECVVREGD